MPARIRTCTEARHTGIGAPCAHGSSREPTAVTLLVVEETAAMCRLIRSVVAGLPATVTECRDPRDVLALCRALQPDWVVIDLDLVGADALATVRQIRQAHAAMRIAVLGEDSPRVREAAERAGARAYLPKENLLLLAPLLAAERA